MFLLTTLMFETHSMSRISTAVLSFDGIGVELWLGWQDQSRRQALCWNCEMCLRDWCPIQTQCSSVISGGVGLDNQIWSFSDQVGV